VDAVSADKWDRITIVEVEDAMLNNGCKRGAMIALTLWMLVCSGRPTFAFECLGPSYTVRQGRNYMDDVTPRELVSGEYESLKQLFQWMEGDWVGKGHTVRCAGPEDGIRKEAESYVIASRGKNRSHGQFSLESNIHNQEAGTRTDLTHDFFLNERRLATSDLSISDIDMLNASATVLAYVKKARIKGAGLFTSHEWVVSIRKASDTSMEIETEFSVNGRLTSTSIWHLERK
jgi:hypothetical protein